MLNNVRVFSLGHALSDGFSFQLTRRFQLKWKPQENCRKDIKQFSIIRRPSQGFDLVFWNRKDEQEVCNISDFKYNCFVCKLYRHQISRRHIIWGLIMTCCFQYLLWISLQCSLSIRRLSKCINVLKELDWTEQKNTKASTHCWTRSLGS